MDRFKNILVAASPNIDKWTSTSSFPAFEHVPTYRRASTASLQGANQ